MGKPIQTVHVYANDMMYSFYSKIILEILWSQKHMHELVKCTNGQGKTPLQLGVEKGCIE